MLARLILFSCSSTFGNNGGNLAGQQIVSNRDSLRVQTSFPAAPWELHQETEEGEEWGKEEGVDTGSHYNLHRDWFDLSVHPLSTLPKA